MSVCSLTAGVCQAYAPWASAPAPARGACATGWKGAEGLLPVLSIPLPVQEQAPPRPRAGRKLLREERAEPGLSPPFETRVPVSCGFFLFCLVKYMNMYASVSCLCT